LVLFRRAQNEAREEIEEENEFAARLSKRGGEPLTGGGAALIYFAIIFAADWGDLTQILSAGLVAQGKDPVGVYVGSCTALRIFGVR
jgi:putative Ca2+/H+ antiporter (TMEM165/GDT1 family)